MPEIGTIETGIITKSDYVIHMAGRASGLKKILRTIHSVTHDIFHGRRSDQAFRNVIEMGRADVKFVAYAFHAQGVIVGIISCKLTVGVDIADNFICRAFCLALLR